jgi:hypothetical protein
LSKAAAKLLSDISRYLKVVPCPYQEEVLNQGMGFISGLMEMATGKKLGVAEGSEKMVTHDRKTGEVTLKFTLPGFSKG